MSFKHLICAAALALGAGSAGAATITPFAADCSSSLADDLGTATACGTDLSRTDASSVNLGAGDGDFFSLGLNGSALFGITPSFTGSVSVIEITFGGSSSSHDEAAQVFVRKLDGTFELIGTADNQGSGADANTSTFTFTGLADAIRLLDVSQTVFTGTSSKDGFDVDALSIVAPVPLPASALMLLAAMGGLGVAARRRKV
jgi:hypothetical protein